MRQAAAAKGQVFEGITSYDQLFRAGIVEHVGPQATGFGAGDSAPGSPLAAAAVPVSKLQFS